MANLIKRDMRDANFAHCIGLIGAMAAWAEELRPGHVLSPDDLNMIAVPVEVALALLKPISLEPNSNGEGARKCFELLETFRAARKMRVRPTKKRKARDREEPRSTRRNSA